MAVALTLTEGRYHQVRRMFAAVGNHVEALHRPQVGGLALGDLPDGQWRILDDADRAVDLEADRLAAGRVKDGLALVGRRPLRAGDEILPPCLGRTGAAAGFRQPLDEAALVVWRDWLHEVMIVGSGRRVARSRKG